MQYATQGYVVLLQAHGVQVSMAGVGCPSQNAYAERLIRTLKDEEVYLNEYEDFEDACHRIGHFLEDVYMTKRVHSALGYLAPAEFEAGQREPLKGLPRSWSQRGSRASQEAQTPTKIG